MALDFKDHTNQHVHKGLSGSQKRIISYSVLLLIGAFCVYRSFFGFDWSDETYYSALSYRFLIGDSLFVNSWDIHQTSAIITLPLVYVFLLFSSGSTAGILLFLRIAFVVFHVLIGIYVSQVIAKRSGYVTAVASAAVIILFAPGGISSFSYNTLALMFVLLSLFLLFDINGVRWRRLKIFMSGAAFALTVQSYPHLIILLPVFLIYIILQRNREKLNEPKPNSILFWLLGILSVFIGFAVFLFVNSSLANLFENISFLFSDPQHEAKSLIVSLIDYANSLYKLFGYACYGITAVTVAALAYSFMCNPKRKTVLKSILLLLSLSLIIWCIYRVLTAMDPNSSTINLLAIPIALMGPAFYFLNERKHDPFIYLYFIGILFSLAVHFGSNNELNGTAYPLILSTVAVIAYCGSFWPNLVAPKVWVYTITLLGILVYIVTTGSIAYARAVNVYRDESPVYLTCRMENGPAAGIYTTEESAEKYEEIISSINAYAPETGTVFYTKLLPFGYLCTDLRPATPAIWTTAFNSSRLELYYTLHPELMPDFIFVVDERYGISNKNNFLDGYLASYIREKGFKEISLDCGIIFIR